MSIPHTPHGRVVTGAHVQQAVHLAAGVLRTRPEADWGAKAGSLDWDCWETVEHLSDDLFSYAVQLGPQEPPVDAHVPFHLERQKPGGPANAIFADRKSGTAGLLQVLEASGALLAAMVHTASPSTRAFHVWGVSDPEGFAAMGVVETLVHTHDVAEGIGAAWQPPTDLCAAVVGRLFPDAPTDTDPWPALLWCTGRTELPGRPRLTDWQWNSAPRDTTGAAE
jgi:hypothetical protein